MSNLQQSHHQIGVEVDASTSALQTTLLREFSVGEHFQDSKSLFPTWMEKNVLIYPVCVL